MRGHHGNQKYAVLHMHVLDSEYFSHMEMVIKVVY